MTYLRQLWQLKKRVADGTAYAGGICVSVHAVRPADFKTWPEFSGWLAYPVAVGGGDKRHGPNSALKQYWAAGDAFWTGEYGSARIRLLNHLIRCEEARDAQQAS